MNRSERPVRKKRARRSASLVGANRRLESGDLRIPAERTRCLQLIDKVASRGLHSDWPDHPVFGRMTGEQVSRLHAKHLNHHLMQFGV